MNPAGLPTAMDKQLESSPCLVQEYLLQPILDIPRLQMINTSILRVFKRSIYSHNALEECHQMALSASKSLVQNLYHNLVPELLKALRENNTSERELKEYLRVWVEMYPGKWRYSVYPNFDEKYGDLVEDTKVPPHLHDTLKYFQRNIKNNQNEDEMEFFEDTLISDSDTDRSMTEPKVAGRITRIIPTQVHHTSLASEDPQLQEHVIETEKPISRIPNQHLHSQLLTSLQKGGHSPYNNIHQSPTIGNSNGSSLRPVDQLIVRKHVPGVIESPLPISKARSRIFGDSRHESRMKSPERLNLSRNSLLGRSVKLSEFSQSKSIRKEVETEEVDCAPDWIVDQYTKFFIENHSFSRFRQNCLFNWSILLLKDDQLEIEFLKSRTSSTTLQIRIVYRNLTKQPLKLRTCYKIAKGCFEVKSNSKIKSTLTVESEEYHQFTLVLKQLPLKVCSLELSLDGDIQIPLPFTVLNYLTNEAISEEEFLAQWNICNIKNYSISKKICYNPKVITVEQMFQLFPHLVSLGRTENYSTQEFGCKWLFEYYDISFLLTLAFNSNACLSLELVSLKPLDPERREFLNYYLSRPEPEL